MKALRVLVAIVLGTVLCAYSFGAAFLSSGRWSMVMQNAVRTSEGTFANVIERNGTTYEYNPNVVSVLLIGCDKENGRLVRGYNGQSDALMLIAIDVTNGDITCIPISRNTKAQIEVFDIVTRQSKGLEQQSLCLAHSYGANDMQSGELCCDAVSRLLGVPIDSFCTFNMSGVSAFADVIGGVELTALEDVHRTDIHEGEAVVLEGQSALDYVWQRDIADDYSSAGRTARQMQFAKAFVEKAASLVREDSGILVRLFAVAQAHLITDLQANEIAYLASTFIQQGSYGLHTRPLPGELKPVAGKMSEFVIDEVAAKDLVLDVFYREVAAE